MTDPANPTTTTLISLAQAQFGRDSTALDADDDLFEALGIDSYKAMALLSRVEDHFGIEVPDYELQDVRTFRQLAVVIDRRR